MKKNILILILILLVVATAFLVFRIMHHPAVTTSTPGLDVNVKSMEITSPAFADNQNLPKDYSCDGSGVNPPLEFSDVPKEAQSLVLVISDPDAPGGTWYHWLVWNIDPATTGIAENSVPEKAVQGQGSSGQNVYGSVCPPSGTHHYIFTLYALSTKLTIPPYSGFMELINAMQGNIITQAQLTGLYSRK